MVRLCAVYAAQGYTDTEIARKLRISPNTLLIWKSRIPEIIRAIASHRAPIAALVEVALAARAVGYSIDEVSVTEKLDENGHSISTTKSRKHIPGSIQAQRYYLNNRQSARWKEKVEMEHSGQINVTFDKEDEAL